jgi:hypothetical protein
VPGFSEQEDGGAIQALLVPAEGSRFFKTLWGQLLQEVGEGAAAAEPLPAPTNQVRLLDD